MIGFLASILGQFEVRGEQKQICVAIMLGAGLSQQSAINFVGHYVEGTPPIYLAETLDRALRRNPHYTYCRDLGQLLPVRLFAIAERGYETFAKQQAEQGARLGDIKPTTFSRMPGWSNIFLGTYVSSISKQHDCKVRYCREDTTNYKAM
jgi:hypothetical protein